MMHGDTFFDIIKHTTAVLDFPPFDLSVLTIVLATIYDLVLGDILSIDTKKTEC